MTLGCRIIAMDRPNYGNAARMITQLPGHRIAALLLCLTCGLFVWQPGPAESAPFPDLDIAAPIATPGNDGIRLVGKRPPPKAGKQASPRQQKGGAGKKKTKTNTKKRGSGGLLKKRNAGKKNPKHHNLTEKQARAELKNVNYKEYAKFKFGKNDLIYGLHGHVGHTQGNHLVKIKQQAGGKTLTDVKLEKHMNVGGRPRLSEPGIKRKSLQVLRTAAKSGRQVHFDLTGTANLKGVLQGNAYKKDNTSAELRYIKNNWHKFKTKPKFYRNGKEVARPW